MSLSQEQITELRTKAGLSPTPPTPTQNGSNDIIAQRKAALSGAAPTAPTASQSTLKDKISSDIQTRGTNAYNDITSTEGNSDNPFVQGTADLSHGIQAAGEAGMGVVDTATDIGSSLLSHLGIKKQDAPLNAFPQGQQATDTIKNAVGNTASNASDELGSKLNDFINAHPELGKVLTNILGAAKGAGDVSNAVLAGEGTADVAQKTTNAVEGAVNKVQSVGDTVQNKATNYAENSLKADWQKPTTVNQAGYKKATQIYQNAADKGHDIADTLVKSKINPADVVDNGRYDTADVANNIRQDAGQMSHDMLRPALEKADAVTPKTSIQEVINNTVDNINKNKSLTQEAKDSLIDKLDTTKGALEKQFPDGMSLTDMHDEKIVRDMNAKYSPVGDIATNAEATKNKAVADSLRNLVETKSPEGIPVKEFNAELAKRYQAADYLDSLNTKKVPTSIVSKLTKTAAKVVGASVGSGLGGGVLGGVGGYHIGGMLEGMLEDIPNPLKTSFLNNLETKNPEAFQKVQDYLNNLDTKGSVAKPMSTASNTVNMPTSIQDTGEEIKNLMKTPNLGLSTQDVTKSMSLAEKGTLRDFTDYVNGSYKPDTEEIVKLKQDAQDIAQKYGFKGAFKGDKALSSDIGKFLDKIGYDKKIK